MLRKCTDEYDGYIRKLKRMTSTGRIQPSRCDMTITRRNSTRVYFCNEIHRPNRRLIWDVDVMYMSLNRTQYYIVPTNIPPG